MSLKPVSGKIESQGINDNFSYLDSKVHVETVRIENELSDRISNIITTPAEGVSEEEIIDARDGKQSLGEKLRDPNKNVKFPYFSDDTFDLDYFWESKSVIASGSVENNPFGSGCEVIGFRGKTKESISRVWVTQIAVVYGAGSILGDSKIRHIIGDESTGELIDKSEWKALGISNITSDLLDENYSIGNESYLSDETFDLNYIWEQGNYVVNEDVKNNYFSTGCTLKVERFKLSKDRFNLWITQTLTGYGGNSRGLVAHRVFLLDESAEEFVYIGDWKVLSKNGNINVGIDDIKILTIGNSFGLNATEYLHRICESAGINVKVGCLYISGGLLSDHDDNIKNNSTAYRYYRRYHINGNITDDYLTDYSVDDALELEDWDYVFFNQASAQSGVYDTFQPYLNDIISHVKSKLPNIKVALMPTWAYSNDFDDSRFDKYNRDQLEMYNTIVDAYKEVMVDIEFDKIIPAGTAIQNARTDDHMNSVDDELTRDGYHLDDTGCYVAGLTMFSTIMGGNIDEVEYRPSTVSSKSAYLGKVAAKNAVMNPFRITKIQ